MDHSSTCILQVSQRDVFGGAERVAWNLTTGARRRGLQSWLAVDHKSSNDSQVIAIPRSVDCYGAWGRFWLAAQQRLRASAFRGTYRLSVLSSWLAEPARSADRFFGIEDFRFPGCRTLLNLPPVRPDIVHCHNLHGGYFDLRTLPRLSSEVPVVLTMHDGWLLSGHCSHSMSCERWKIGCGNCPDLTLYPAVRRDATAYNWRRKQKIYKCSRLFVATPCRWLMDKVTQSMLAAGIIERRVIPNGIDLDVFQPGGQSRVRITLGLPTDAKVLLFAANQWIRESRAKDYGTLRKAVQIVSERLDGKRVILVALGEAAPTEQVGAAEIRFVPYQNDPAVVASYYQAADVYVHAAHADTFPTTILEALASGTPVVATAICGIPEQINGLASASELSDLNRFDLREATGILVSPANAETMAAAILRLLTDDPVRLRLAANARQDARARFDLQRQVDDYLQWYADILQGERRRANPESAHASCQPSALERAGR